MGTWDVLERHFGGLSADEVDAELATVPPRGATPAAASAAAYLAEHGGPDLDSDGGAHGSLHRRRALTAAHTLSDTLASAFTLDQAADLLGVSRSRLSHRLTDQSLWAFTVRARRYLPRWQFTDDRTVLPGLAQVVPAIPAALHPLAVDAFMTSTHPDFDGHTPVEWLNSGGDPAAVADWLTGMAHE